ncbi:MAG: type I restriction enzyme HsdR N-terminal domain-containing protein [Nitrospirota bacterium]
MKCRKPDFLDFERFSAEGIPEDRPELPDKLTDCLTGTGIPFTNRDNIRQKALRFLIEEKGYHREDISVDRGIKLEIEGRKILSLVDILIGFNDKTLMIWKCASGSLVTRERQIIASARLLEDYIVPLAAVTNGKDLELLDTYSEKVIGSGFQTVPARSELIEFSKNISLKPVNREKIIYEQRILYTYDAISCPPACNSDPEK